MTNLMAMQSLTTHDRCARGEMENRIKELQLGLFADRTLATTSSPTSSGCCSQALPTPSWSGCATSRCGDVRMLKRHAARQLLKIVP